jgi:hypothetical protein
LRQATRATKNDSFNLFHPLPLVSQDHTTHRPIHRGIDFSYDSIKSKLRVAIRFRRAYSGDPSLSRHLNFDLQTPDTPSDNDGSDASSTFGSEAAVLVAVEEEVEIAAGQTLRSNTVVVLMVWSYA